jgi:hypothetical protein
LVRHDAGVDLEESVNVASLEVCLFAGCNMKELHCTCSRRVWLGMVAWPPVSVCACLRHDENEHVISSKFTSSLGEPIHGFTKSDERLRRNIVIANFPAESSTSIAAIAGIVVKQKTHVHAHNPHSTRRLSITPIPSNRTNALLFISSSIFLSVYRLPNALVAQHAPANAAVKGFRAPRAVQGLQIVQTDRPDGVAFSRPHQRRPPRLSFGVPYAISIVSNCSKLLMTVGDGFNLRPSSSSSTPTT